MRFGRIQNTFLIVTAPRRLAGRPNKPLNSASERPWESFSLMVAAGLKFSSESLSQRDCLISASPA